MGEMAIHLRADLHLAFIEGGPAAAAYGTDPVIESEAERHKAALGSFSDRGETRVGQKQIPQALAILVGRAANRLVESLCEFLECCRRQAGRTGILSSWL